MLKNVALNGISVTLKLHRIWFNNIIMITIIKSIFNCIIKVYDMMLINTVRKVKTLFYFVYNLGSGCQINHHENDFKLSRQVVNAPNYISNGCLACIVKFI